MPICRAELKAESKKLKMELAAQRKKKEAAVTETVEEDSKAGQLVKAVHSAFPIDFVNCFMKNKTCIFMVTLQYG
jgi:hypothetical protein